LLSNSSRQSTNSLNKLEKTEKQKQKTGTPVFYLPPPGVSTNKNITLIVRTIFLFSEFEIKKIEGGVWVRKKAAKHSSNKVAHPH
jgi:hypothetical protein